MTDVAVTIVGATGLSLHPEHVADLRRSGLSDETILQMGAHSLAPADQARLLGPERAAKVTSVLALPYPGIGFIRYRLYPPLVGENGHGTMKYFQPAGSDPQLYVPHVARDVLLDATVPLVICEGEKKAAAIGQAGLSGVGIGGLWCWRHQGRMLPALTEINWIRRPVFLVPDSDVWSRDELLQPVYAFGQELISRGAVIEVVQLPPATKGADDYLVAHPGADLTALPRLKLTEPPLTRVAAWWKGWSKAQTTEAEAEADALTLLKGGRSRVSIHPAQAVLGDGFAYGVPTAGDLVLVTSARKAYTASELPEGITLDPEALERSTVSRDVALRWVKGATGSVAQALDQLRTFLTKYIVLRRPGIALLVAAWILGTWCFRVFPIFPYLAIRSPEKRCGKTRLLKLIRMLSFNSGPVTALPTEAQLYREAVLTGGTQLFDEMEGLKRDRERFGALVSVLNVGFEAGGVVTRMEKREDEFAPVRYEVYAPRALAGISALTETLEDRALPVFMERRRRSESVGRLTSAVDAEAAPLRDACALAILEKIASIHVAIRKAPAMLEAAGVDDRATDLWVPLLALGLAADAEDGGTRSETLMDLAKTVGELRDADQGEGFTARLVTALEVIRTGRQGTDTRTLLPDDTVKLAPDELLQALQGQTGFEWVKTTRRLAGLLNPLGLVRTRVRQESKLRWVYCLEQAALDDLVARYVPSEPDSGVSTP